MPRRHAALERRQWALIPKTPFNRKAHTAELEQHCPVNLKHCTLVLGMPGASPPRCSGSPTMGIDTPRLPSIENPNVRNLVLGVPGASPQHGSGARTAGTDTQVNLQYSIQRAAPAQRSPLNLNHCALVLGMPGASPQHHSGTPAIGIDTPRPTSNENPGGRNLNSHARWN